MDEKELAKQLSTYADSFTAFSFVQGAAFCILVLQSVTAGCLVRSRWYLAGPCIALAGAGYLLLISLCHREEDRLIGLPVTRGETIKKVIPVIRNTRFALVLIATLGELAIVLGAAFLSPAYDCASKAIKTS
jgi:hypothetical protein